jgi:hypothetical protein
MWHVLQKQRVRVEENYVTFRTIVQSDYFNRIVSVRTHFITLLARTHKILLLLHDYKFLGILIS